MLLAPPPCWPPRRGGPWLWNAGSETLQRRPICRVAAHVQGAGPRLQPPSGRANSHRPPLAARFGRIPHAFFEVPQCAAAAGARADAAGAQGLRGCAPRPALHSAPTHAPCLPATDAGKAMYNLAHSYMKLGDRIAALQFFQDCVAVVRKSGDWQVEIYCNMKVAQLSVDTCVRARGGAPTPPLSRASPSHARRAANNGWRRLSTWCQRSSRGRRRSQISSR